MGIASKMAMERSKRSVCEAIHADYSDDSVDTASAASVPAEASLFHRILAAN
jgi:hypothetical protein